MTSMTNVLEPIERALRRARQREDSRNRDTLYFPAAYERDLHLALAETAQKTVDRIIICSTESPDVNAFHRTIWRDVAASGPVSRAVYVLSHTGLIRSALTELVKLDVEAGISVRIVAVGDLPDSVALATVTETVLVDSSVAALAPRGESRQSQAAWTVTVSDGHVAESRRLMKEIWQLAFPADRLPVNLNLDEPLVQSASIISGVAPVLCSGNHVDSKGCAWYHGTWQFLRLMDLVSTPTWHHEFYQSALAAAEIRGARRILITGTADYSVLAYSIEAFRSRAKATAATFTVVDLCGTPLFACQWYAKREGVNVETVADDIFRFASRTKQEYDVIITDAFLTRFSALETERVLGAWSGLLADNGEVITTIRAHAESQLSV